MALLGKELLFDVIKGGVLTLALFLAFVSFPVIGLLPGVFVPLPAIYYYCKRGAVTGLTIFVLTTVVLLIMGERSVTLLYLLQSGIISLLLPMFYLQGKGAARAIVFTTGINYLLIVLLAVVYGIWSGTALQATLQQGITTSTEQAITVYSKQGLSADELEMLSQGIRQAGQLMVKTFPALLLVATGLIASLNFTALLRLATARLPDLPQPGQLQTFRNPDTLVWIVIVSGFSMLLPQAAAQRMALNILIVCSVVYFVQGLAVILVYFQRYSLPALARFFFWLILMFQPYLCMLIAFLGIFDTWGDFRTPKQKNL